MPFQQSRLIVGKKRYSFSFDIDSGSWRRAKHYFAITGVTGGEIYSGTSCIESCHNVAQFLVRATTDIDHAVTSSATNQAVTFQVYFSFLFHLVITYRTMSVQDVYNNFYSRFSSVREYLAPVLKNSKFKETGCITPEEVCYPNLDAAMRSQQSPSPGSIHSVNCWSLGCGLARRR